MPTAPTTYHLTAQDDFQCLAGDCPASCCNGWQIEVEPELVERWKTLPDHDDRQRFPALVRHDPSGKLFMTGRDRPRCGLLNADNLCDAHARYGVEYTPLTCRSFPRMQEQAGAVRMESASPACPVIARRLVMDERAKPLLRCVPTREPVVLDDPQERTRLGLTDLLNRLMQEDTFPISVRLYWLADQTSRWAAVPAAAAALLASLDASPEMLRNELTSLAEQHAGGALHPDPVIAGSFWNTIYQLGHARQLLPSIDRNTSALRAGLHGLPADRRGFYAAVYDEVMRLRGQAFPEPQGWNVVGGGRLLHLHLLNAGFPWQPSLGDHRLSFAHAMIFNALTRLKAWMTAGPESAKTEIAIQAVYRTARAFGHNTLIPEQIRTNPALLQLDRYHTTWLDW